MRKRGPRARALCFIMESGDPDARSSTVSSGEAMVPFNPQEMPAAVVEEFLHRCAAKAGKLVSIQLPLHLHPPSPPTSQAKTIRQGSRRLDKPAASVATRNLQLSKC